MPNPASLSRASSKGSPPYGTVNTPSFMSLAPRSRLDLGPLSRPVARHHRLHHADDLMGLREGREGWCHLASLPVGPDRLIELDEQIPQCVGPPLLVPAGIVGQGRGTGRHEARVAGQLLIGLVAPADP